MPKNKIKTVSNEILPHPDLPPINFRIGQTVWQANSIWTGKATQCNVCDGNRNITVNVPKSDRAITLKCPNCYGTGIIDGAYRYYPSVDRLTVVSIRVDTLDRNSKVSYMMDETSDRRGSGSIHYQKNLYATEQEAMAAAEKKSIDDMIEHEKTHVLDPETNSWRKKDR